MGDRADGLAVADYRTANFLLLGAALGGGATLGELPNSFVKRQVGIPPGARGRGRWAPIFYLWDQLDLLMPTWPFLLARVRLDWPLVAMSVALVLILHQALSTIGYVVGARRSIR